MCLLCLEQQRGHYSCLMAHFPTSACCSPVALRCILSSHSLSHSPPSSPHPPATHFYHSMSRVFFPPSLSPGSRVLFCFFLPQLLSFPSFFSLSLPPFTCHLSSLSHLVCNHFVICGPACCHCIMWVIVTIMVMMTVICHIKMFTSAFRRHSKWVQIGE